MTGMSDIELQPDATEVIQEEAPEYVSAIEVCVKDVKVPVRVQELPRKLATSRTLTITTTPAKILRADHWRASARITSFDEDVYIAFNEASAQDTSTMARWAADVPYTHTATTEVWIRSLQNTSEISVITERWATGD